MLIFLALGFFVLLCRGVKTLCNGSAAPVVAPDANNCAGGGDGTAKTNESRESVDNKEGVVPRGKRRKKGKRTKYSSLQGVEAESTLNNQHADAEERGAGAGSYEL